MSDRLDPAPLPEGVDIPAADWQQTPPSVRLVLRTLLKRLDALEARLNRDSPTSSRPPSSDAPSKKRQRRVQASTRRKPGAKPGHRGHRQVLLEPTTTMALFPGRSFLSRVVVATPSVRTWPPIIPIRWLRCPSFSLR